MLPKRIAVIGGGISGLAAAHRLVELGVPSSQITLIEAGARLGGTLETKHRDGFLLERGPDSFISEKPEAVALAKRLGLESRLIETNNQHRRSFIVRNGRLRAVPEGFQLLAPSRVWPFITTDIFSLTGKLRIAAELLLPRQNGREDESLASFVRRRLGREALERMAQPMVGGIYTADPETLSLRATLPRFLDMERKHRSLILAMMRQGQKAGTSGARYSLFLSFDRGMEVLVDALADVAPNVRLKTRIEEISFDSRTWRLRADSGDSFEADAVCLAVPAYTAAKLLEYINPRLASQLNAIKYASTATINLAYPRAAIGHRLNGFGFVVPFIEKRSLIACTFSSVKFAERAPEEHVLLRAFAGGALQPDVFALDESELLTRIEADLREFLNIDRKPLFTEIAKWESSMPQYEVGHLDRVQAIENEVSGLRGLALAGNAYRGAGIPDCIRSGESAAESLVTEA
ncbi:MAG TPA: protoporphyrinogen oxidase [Pyrinomonadaceae bacterium]|nr:protoporphyrinogen oxidase [Pyrinomonadaceae bacterium]